MSSAGHDPDSSRRAIRIEIGPRTIWYGLLAIGLVWIAWQLTTVLIVMTVALMLAGALDPIVAWLERRGLKRGRALVIVFVVMTVILAAVLLLTVPPLVSQLLRMIEDAPKGKARLVDWLRGYRWAKPIMQSINAVPIDTLVVKASTALVGYSSELLVMIGYGITTLVLAIYLLIDPMRAKALLYTVVPRNYHIKLARILIELKDIVGGYVRGQLITSLAIGVFVFGVLTAFQVDNALAIALFAAITDLVPFIGGYLASAPCVIAVSSYGAGVMIIMVAIMAAYQEFESRILVPRVYGRVLRLPSAIVLISLLIGGTLMGILGALLALPIAAGVRMIIRELRVPLPGEAAADDLTAARDEKVAHMYEQMSEGASAQESAAIAGELAEKIKHNEKVGPIPSAQIKAAEPSEPEPPAEPQGSDPVDRNDDPERPR